MLNLFAIAALLIVPVDTVVRESCDLIELNHFYDEHGRLTFDQVIFWDWESSEDRFNVRSWRLVKKPEQVPQRDWRDGGYSATWQDGEQTRQIHAASIRETWTQYDPELAEREHLAKERRRPLRAK